MKVYIKGGAWSNSEDEALKACIQKYGDKDWGKIASVISRKSADQCKARWTEWLHPDIKKDDFTADEDEKLLMLGRVLKGQWRTISSQLKGRTAAMCQDRFAELVELAENQGALSEEFVAQMKRDRDQRLDSRPAKKDVKDTTGYEAQLQEELTARLANKKGKKGLRKERQDQLEDTQFRVKLQRQRELAEAGAMTISQQKKMNRLVVGGEASSAVNEDGEGDAEGDAEGAGFTPMEFDKVWHSGAKRKGLEVVSHLEKKRLREEAEGTEGLSAGLSTVAAAAAAAPNATAVPQQKPSILAGKLLPPALRAKLALQQSAAAPSLAGSLPAPKSMAAALPPPQKNTGTAGVTIAASVAAKKAAPAAVKMVPYTSVLDKLAAAGCPAPLTTTTPSPDTTERTAAFLVATEARKLMRADMAAGGAAAVEPLEDTYLQRAADAVRGVMPPTHQATVLGGCAMRIPDAPYAAAQVEDGGAFSQFQVQQAKRLRAQLEERKAALKKDVAVATRAPATSGATMSRSAAEAAAVSKIREQQRVTADFGAQRAFYEGVLVREREEIAAREGAMDANVDELKRAMAQLQGAGVVA